MSDVPETSTVAGEAFAARIAVLAALQPGDVMVREIGKGCRQVMAVREVTDCCVMFSWEVMTGSDGMFYTLTVRAGYLFDYLAGQTFRVLRNGEGAPT